MKERESNLIHTLLKIPSTQSINPTAPGAHGREATPGCPREGERGDRAQARLSGHLGCSGCCAK